MPEKQKATKPRKSQAIKKTTSSIKSKNKGRTPQKKKKKRVKGLIERVKENLFHKEIWVKGKEPPKSYSFEKKFFGFYILFVFYSFVILWMINAPENFILNLLMFGNPYAFCNAILAFFITLSLLISIDKFKVFLFENKTAVKQVILYIGLISLFFILFTRVSMNINFITYLLALSMVWLILLSARFYMYSRKFATKIESRFISKYSRSRYFLAIIIPFFIIGVLGTSLCH